MNKKSIKSDLIRIDHIKDSETDYSDIPLLDKPFFTKPTSVPLPGAEIYYLRDFALNRSPADILDALIYETPWRHERVTIWGKPHLQPRLVAWYGDPGRVYAYSGIKLAPRPWTELLSDLRRRIELAVGASFNSVLLNYYRDHRDSMGFHSDDEPELGVKPTIASLSLGEERTFILKSKADKSLRPVRIKLSSGSLLLMKGDTQTNWKHAIHKEIHPCGPRINLTFRYIHA